MVQTNAIKRVGQRSQDPCQGQGVKTTKNGSVPAAKLSTYMKSPEALWRMLASYPKGMPVEDAIRRARVDFTKASAPASLACYQRDERKEVVAA